MTGRDRRPIAELDDAEAVTALWRTGRRAALLGLLATGGSALLLVGAITVLPAAFSDSGYTAGGAEAVATALQVIALVALGPAIGLMLASTSFTDQVTRFGGSSAEGRRLRRAVFRKNARPLSPDEQELAARYAPVGVAWARFQLLSSGVLYFTLLLLQVPPLLRSASGDGFDLRGLSIAVIALLVVTFAVMLPLQLRAMGRATRYARTHPHPPAARGAG